MTVSQRLSERTKNLDAHVNTNTGPI